MSKSNSTDLHLGFSPGMTYFNDHWNLQAMENFFSITIYSDIPLLRPISAGIRWNANQ